MFAEVAESFFQLLQLGSLDLVANAVVLWNTLYAGSTELDAQYWRRNRG